MEKFKVGDDIEFELNHNGFALWSGNHVTGLPSGKYFKGKVVNIVCGAVVPLLTSTAPVVVTNNPLFGYKNDGEWRWIMDTDYLTLSGYIRGLREQKPLPNQPANATLWIFCITDTYHHAQKRSTDKDPQQPRH